MIQIHIHAHILLVAYGQIPYAYVCIHIYEYLYIRAQVDGMTTLTVTDAFTTTNALWYFRTKNEDTDEEGNTVHVDFESATPVYIQHSSGTWLSQAMPDKKTSKGAPIFDDARDVFAGMYVCMHVYVSVCLSVCMNVCMHVCVYACVCLCVKGVLSFDDARFVCAVVYACMCVCIYLCAGVYACFDLHL